MQTTPVEIRTTSILSAAIFDIVAMLMAILKKKVCGLGANVKKMLYAKHPAEIRKVKFWSTATLNIVAILEIKLTNTITGWS